MAKSSLMYERAEAVKHFLDGERAPIKRETVCEFLGKASRYDIHLPNLSASEWDAELSLLIESGEVIESDHCVCIRRVEVVAPVTQKELF